MSEQTQGQTQETGAQTTQAEDPPVGSKDPVTKRTPPVKAEKK